MLSCRLVSTNVSLGERSGSGSPADFRTQIFEKFAQVDGSNTRRTSGTGLGLSISKAIVKKHDGQIEFESELGKAQLFSSTYRIFLATKARTLFRGSEAILCKVRFLRHGPIVDEPPRHNRNDAAFRVAVICRHAGVRPNHAFVFRIDPPDIYVMDVLADVNRIDPALEHLHKARSNITRLAFGLENRAPPWPKPRVGTLHGKQVRESRNRDAEVCGGIIVCPNIREVFPPTDRSHSIAPSSATP